MLTEPEQVVAVEQVQRVLSDLAVPPRSWDAADSAVLASYHRQLTASRWADHRALNEPVAREAMMQLVTGDEALRSALKRRSSPMDAGLTLPGRSVLAGCTTHTTGPPYPGGDPLTEEFGVDAMIVGDQVAGPSSSQPSGLMFGELAGPDGMKTFSQLALPADGSVALAVALGKLRITPTASTVHPPSDEYPQQFPVPGGSLEVTAAAGTVGVVLPFSVPGAPTPEARADVTVELSIGTGTRPFYLVVPPVQGPPILQAFGVVHVYLSGSNGEESEAEGTFLQHEEGALSLIGTPIVRRQLTIDCSLPLQPAAWYVYVSVLVRLVAHRWFILPPAPLRDRDGFVGIDLRTARTNSHSVHALLEPNGPVTVRRIELNVCREDSAPQLRPQLPH